MTVICLRDEGFNVFRVQQTTGAVTGRTEDTVADSSKTWITNEWQNHAVRFTAGNHNGRSYNIISNTADKLTCTIPKGSAVSGENIGTGDGTAKDFSGTLADPVDPGTLSITDGVETFTDNSGTGTLTGDQTGTGTITYTTGAWTVTFNTAPTDGQAITADYTPVYNFNCDGGLANGDTFEIILPGEDLAENTTPPGSADLTDQAVSTIAVTDDTGFALYEDLAENTTPPGSATLTDQPIIGTTSIQDAGFVLYSDTLKGQVFTVSALVDGGVEDSTQSWTENRWIGYRIEFTSGALSGKAYLIAINSATDIHGQGVNFSDGGVIINDTFKIVPYFFLLVEDAVPSGAADLTDQDIEILVQHYNEGFWFYFVLVEETWGAPPVFGVRHGRGLGLSIHSATRFGIFPKGEAARGLK